MSCSITINNNSDRELKCLQLDQTNISLDVNPYSLYISTVYESYARSEPDHLQIFPKEPGDFRERVERETIRG